MAHISKLTQEETFAQRVKIALIRRRKSVDWLALRLGRPQPSVSKAINQDGLFPNLKREIAHVLGIAL